VVCAAVVGVLTSKLTGRWAWALAAALVAAVLLWAGIEAWRAVTEKDAGGSAGRGTGIRQRARRVAGLMIGTRGPVTGQAPGISVDQKIGTIRKGGVVIGVETDRPTPGRSAETGDAPPG
jgi:hypothetical protein